MKYRCAIVKDAGRRIDRSNVAWYDVPYGELLDNYFNTGDMCVYDSTLKILDYDGALDLRINTDLPVDSRIVAEVRESCDYILLRASNYVHEEMEWGYFLSWLEALQLPVLCVGIGAQAANNRRIELSDDSRRIWQMIAERTPSIGVRGTFTASVLSDNGVKNAEVIGCPTIFRTKNPGLQLRHKEFDEVESVIFSLRRETSANYTPDIASFLDIQKRIMLRLAAQFPNFAVSAHGECEEKAYFYNDYFRIKRARQVLRDSGWFDERSGPELEDIYYKHLFFSTVVSHYDEYVKSFDYTIGYRVHGVLPALASGVPGILLRYDARSAELAETLHVPLLDPQEVAGAPLNEVFCSSRFRAFEQNYAQLYCNMKKFLEKNGVMHRM